MLARRFIQLCWMVMVVLFCGVSHIFAQKAGVPLMKLEIRDGKVVKYESVGGTTLPKQDMNVDQSISSSRKMIVPRPEDKNSSGQSADPNNSVMGASQNQSIKDGTFNTTFTSGREWSRPSPRAITKGDPTTQTQLFTVPAMMTIPLGSTGLPSIKKSKAKTPTSAEDARKVVGWQTIMSEGFEGVFPESGWSCFANAGYTNAYWDDVNYRSHTGSWSGYCAAGGTSAVTAPGPYRANMNGWMVYGPFSLADASDANMQFYYWLASESGYDQFGWGVSTNGSNFYGWQSSGTSGGWISQTVDLKNVYSLGNVTGQSQVWVACWFTSDATNQYEGAYVDDFLLQKNVSSTPLPDLAWTSLSNSPGDTWTVGQSITSQLTESNTGTATAGAHQSQLYLSTDNVITTSDVALGSHLSFTSIAAGGTQTQSVTFTVPSVSSGTYYMGALVDVTNAVTESNETNNGGVRGGQITITPSSLPDLAWTSLSNSPGDTWTVGQSITSQLTEANNGGSTAGAHQSQLYLSTDNVITTGDVALGSQLSFTSIAAGGTQTQSVTFTVPSVSTGTYYMGALVDVANAVSESDETNNGGVRGGQITVSPSSSIVQQSIALVAGWNMISGYVMPQQSAMDSIFRSIASAIVIVKNGAGQVYWPSYSINQIGSWQLGGGYQAYANAAVSLTLSGQKVAPESTPLILAQGWNLFAYLRSSQMYIVQALATTSSGVVIVKNNAGQVYWPAYSINQIGSMQPGQGYLGYFSRKDTLTYPVNTSLEPSARPNTLAMNRSQVHFTPLTSTGPSATVLIFVAEARDGDEIAATARGMIVGSGVVESGKCILSIWGDNPMTADIVDGAVEGDPLAFRIWSALSNKELPLTITTSSWIIGHDSFEAGPNYHENSAAVLQGQFAVHVIPTIVSMEQNYPNPFNPSTTIRYSVPQEEHVSLEVYNLLGQRVATLIDGLKEAGEYDVVFDASHLATGVYVYKLTAGSSVTTKKLLLAK